MLDCGNCVDEHTSDCPDFEAYDPDMIYDMNYEWEV